LSDQGGGMQGRLQASWQYIPGDHAISPKLCRVQNTILYISYLYISFSDIWHRFFVAYGSF